jgi:hypothetical protein
MASGNIFSGRAQTTIGTHLNSIYPRSIGRGGKISCIFLTRRGKQRASANGMFDFSPFKTDAPSGFDVWRHDTELHLCRRKDKSLWIVRKSDSGFELWRVNGAIGSREYFVIRSTELFRVLRLIGYARRV